MMNIKGLPKISWQIFIVVLVMMSLRSAFAVDFVINKFELEGENPLGDKLSHQILAPFLGKHSNLDRLREATRLLEAQLIKKGFAFHRVSLPPQTLTNGAVRVLVESLSLASINVEGNSFYSDDNIRKSLPQLQAGKPPNSKILTRVLAVANANSAKRTRLTFGRGSAAKTIDAQLIVNDIDPVQLYAWVNNTGSDQTTNSRLGLGFSNRNLGDKDHQISLSASTSPEDVNKVTQAGLNYIIPIYKTAGIMNLLAAKSSANTGTVAEVFDISGEGTTLGVGYTQILNKIGNLRQKATINLYDKLFENTIDFSGSDIGQDIRSRPINVGYQGEWEKNRWTGLFNINHSVNLSGGNFNDEDSYEKTTAGANQDWQKSSAFLAISYKTDKDWLAEMSMALQETSDVLISGERMGLGGVRDLRGFDEREITFDKGSVVNIATWAPSRKNVTYGGFFSIGHGSLINPQVGEVASDTLSSAGVGVKINWRSRLLFDLSIGQVIDGIDREGDTQDGDVKAHFNLLYRFK